MKGCIRKRLLPVLLCGALTLGGWSPAAQGMMESKKTLPETDVAATTDRPSYSQYQKQDFSIGRHPQTLLADAATAQEGCQKSEEGLETGAEGYLEWTITVPEAGWYTLAFEYMALGEDAADIERSLTINGEIPFEQVKSLTFSRVWENAAEEMTDGHFPADSAGNELSPSQQPVKQWQTTFLRDTSGERVVPYWFALKAGENTIRLTGVRGRMQVKTLVVEVPDTQKDTSYAAYLARYEAADYTGETQLLQGEAAVRKSSSVLVPQTDRSSPATMPSDPVQIRLNTIGGSGWSSPGQWIEWTVDAPETGWYVLGIKYRQNLVSGMFTTRTLTINGELPFAEAAVLEFPYNGNWQAKLLSDTEGTPYRFYLEKGENTLRLEATTGRAAAIYTNAEQSVRDLNEAYRQIIMLTSASPDPLRNYRIDKALPEVMRVFSEQITQLRTISQQLVEISGKKGSVNTVLDNLSLQLQSFVDKPITIPSRLDSYKQNVSSLASWLYELSSQPLEIDYMTFSAPQAGVPQEISNIQAGFWTKLLYEIKAFLGSYVTDYSQLSGEDTEANESIDVWVNSGRDQAAILKKLVDNRFTLTSGVKVNVKIMTSVTGVSSLLLATVSGMGPDVAMTLANADPVNYACRGAAVDLSQFPGFEEVKQRFMGSAMEPYAYQNGYYALPETQGFPLMFYRTDILEEMQLQPPETWEDLYTLIGDLQKKYMTVGIPGDLSYLATRLYQSGEELYNEDKSQSLLGGQQALKQFKLWTELYTSYSLPLDYDAANRFRTGEMPLVIADYSFFNRMSVLAPELKGQWAFREIPGTRREDGSVDRTAVSNGTAMMMLKATDNPQAAWKFMDWWTTAEIQTAYGRELECMLGVAARHPSANREAMQNLPWRTEEYAVLENQWNQTRGIPEIPGSYYVARNVDNALRNVLSYGNDPQEVLKEYALTINEEIHSKRQEFGLE